ncbi:MAG TPA: hypothetical protein VK154_08585 [Chitinophagales bacterium]|nr:hypothetical protein [Chitinophagales bacterium]
MDNLTHSRKLFLRNIALASVVLGIEPLSLFSNNINPIEGNTISINEAHSKYIAFMKQYANFQTSSSLSFSELHSQHTGIIKILSETSKPNFKNLSEEKKIKRIKEIDAFAPTVTQTKADTDAYYNQLKEFMDSVGVVSGMTGTVYQGALLLGHALSPALYPLALSPIIAVPLFIGTAGMAAWQVYDLIGNADRNKKIHEVNSFFTIETLNENVYKKYLSTSNFSFTNDVTGFKFNVSGNNLDASKLFGDTHTSNHYEKDLMSFLRANIGTTGIFTSKEQLESFLDKYVEKVGAVQKQAIEDLLEAQKDESNKEAILQRDKAAFYQSINAFVGLAINNLASSPKEAQILNTLISAGFQCALYGGMTPVGWTAVAINVASVMAFNNSNGKNFEKATFKMLAQIQRQLNIIIKNIDVLHKTQIEILIELKSILEEVIETQNIINRRFDEFQVKQNIMYQAILSIEQQNTQAEFNGYDRNLKNRIIDNPETNAENEVYSNLRDMKNLMLDKLSLKAFTRFDNVSMNSQTLKEEILFKRSNFLHNIPLYNTIGLIPVLDNYNPLNDTGQSNSQIIHPVEFYSASNGMIYWLMHSKLSQQEKSTIVNDLITGIESSRKILNRCADFPKIQEKSNNHLTIVNSFILKTRLTLNNLHAKNFTNKTDLRKELLLDTKSQINYEGIVDKTMKSNNLRANFYDNNNDNSLVNLLRDLGIATVVTQETKKEKMSAFGGLQNAAVMDLKKNKIEIRKATFDYSNNLEINIDIQYSGKLLASKIEYWSTQGAGGYVVKETISSYEFNDAWKKNLKQYIKTTYNKNIEDVLPTFSDITITDFLNHLVNQKMRSVKKVFINDVKKNILDTNKAINGTGLALMVLTKLNQLITSESVIPYTADYSDELFLKEDIENILNFAVNTNFKKTDDIFFNQLLHEHSIDEILDEGDKANSIFYYKKADGAFSEKLDPNNFADFVTILLNKKLYSTVKKCLTTANSITERDCEPHFAEALNNLNGFKRVYLT